MTCINMHVYVYLCIHIHFFYVPSQNIFKLDIIHEYINFHIQKYTYMYIFILRVTLNIYPY